MNRLQIIIIGYFFLLSGCSQLPEGFVKYQTFDEFRLKGVNIKDSIIKEPFVGVEEKNDSISVMICERFKKRILFKFIKYKDYWYNLRKQQEPSNCGCDTTPHYTERFLFNDTIMEYGYYLKNGEEKSLEVLDFITEKNIISLSDSAGFMFDKSNKFHDLKKNIYDFKNKFEPYDVVHQKRCYNIYRKEFANDTLFIIDVIGNKVDKPGYFVQIRKLNSLGLFDPELGKSILNDVLNSKKHLIGK